MLVEGVKRPDLRVIQRLGLITRTIACDNRDDDSLSFESPEF
jgi:hypothetical protein